MVYSNLFAEIKDDMAIVETELSRYARQSETILGRSSEHLLCAGGKRLRPAFVLLSGHLFDCSSKTLRQLAVAVELIHMASLVHDDVIDNASLRRGLPTVKACWGNQIALYSGSYLFAQAIRIVAEHGNEKIAAILSNLTMRMCEGEIEQIKTAGMFNMGLRDYLRRNKRKTALLFACCCLIGALASKAPEAAARSLNYYGYYLGMAFQITDDILDFTSSEKIFGKPVVSDLRQGIFTLPVIYALKTPGFGDSLRKILMKKEKSETDWEQSLKLVTDSGALDSVCNLGKKYLEKAKEQLILLPQTTLCKKFGDIADFIGARNF